MSNNNENRVLSRIGARQLTSDELEQITAAGGPFTILRFPEPDLPDVVYLEQLNSALYLDQPGDVIDYVTIMDQLCVQADTGTASKDMLRALLR